MNKPTHTAKLGNETVTWDENGYHYEEWLRVTDEANQFIVVKYKWLTDIKSIDSPKSKSDMRNPMTQDKVEWHNPDNLSKEQLGEGWRFLLKDEMIVPEDGEFWAFGGWVRSNNKGKERDETRTYRTRQPLPTEKEEKVEYWNVYNMDIIGKKQIYFHETKKGADKFFCRNSECQSGKSQQWRVTIDGNGVPKFPPEIIK